jgi:predicted  nucleic acid-binding Zn-ribbon protein
MPTRRIAARKSRKARPRAKAKPEVSRYEYAQLCMQLARMETLVARNRTDLDIQLRRIAQLQDELDTIKKALTTPAFPSDSLVIPLPKTTAES